jgi:uncharacterized protein (DUF697 family)
MMESTHSNVKKRFDKANNVVRNYSIASVGVGLVPVPLVDLVTLTGLQTKMLHSLSEIYEFEFSKEASRSIISSLAGSSLSTSLATVFSSLIKGLPGVGTAAGVASMPVIGGAATYAIGKVFIQHFESGGTFLDFDPDKVREYFAKEFAEGRLFVHGAQTEIGTVYSPSFVSTGKRMFYKCGVRR